MKERRRIIYTGLVQGVGFRATVLRLAQPYPVAGWVRNLPNGSVELIVEGEAATLDDLQLRVAQRMREYIQNVQVDLEAPQGLEGFVIRYS